MARMIDMERVVFTNSGTEAVMTAVRLARTATGRQKVVIFTNSYHGTFDGILGCAKGGDPLRTGTPVAPGIPSSLVHDLIVLDYGTLEALTYIQEHGATLAAVMVESVQSRHPEHQFGSFLKDVRELTIRSGTALIFYEVITGFRTGPGGAQAHFGVKADIATYGKVLGGGLPIGAVAGKALYIDPIDGGVWTYGDDSVPEKDLTFFAGIFCKHPLTMAAAQATLKKLEDGKGAIQKDLNEKVAALVGRLNGWFEAENVPVKLVNFGSLFRFAFAGNFDLLFYHLVSKGVYIWEGRNLFISTAHTKADIDLFEQATKEALIELREAGFNAGGTPAKK
ncbi:MAG: aminotransferase class III-fold pyridoxal phosphate-dependent enzyme [Chitinophagaceae bacterium]|nr:aminotransferase class III-fold pyridoxal phosphate-dependent enzyme [Oligoflexus sp.]